MKTPTEVMAEAGSYTLDALDKMMAENASFYDTMVSAYLEGYRAALRESSGLIGEAMQGFCETSCANAFSPQMTTTTEPSAIKEA